MNSRAALNIGLAVAALALGAALFFGARIDREDGQQAFALVPEQAQNLVRIEIERRGQSPMVLERSGERWRMSAPLAARLEEIQLGRVLDVARFRALERMPARDLARFDLHRPWAQMRFNGHAIDFGTTNSLTEELYLRSGEHVYAVPARLAAAVPATASKLLAHRLLGPDEQPARFQLEGFSVSYDGERWLLQPAAPGLSQDDYVRWVDQWRHASSVATQPGRRGPHSASIRIALSDGRTIDIAVLERTPNLVLLRRDEQIEYHLLASLAPALLAPPAAASAPKP